MTGKNEPQVANRLIRHSMRRFTNKSLIYQRLSLAKLLIKNQLSDFR